METSAKQAMEMEQQADSRRIEPGSYRMHEKMLDGVPESLGERHVRYPNC